MKVKSGLTRSETEIIRRLKDETYTVEFFENFLSSADTAESEEQKIEAAGFFRAVQKAAEADLHIFPEAYIYLFNNIINTADKFTELSESFKTLTNNTEDLFILSDEAE